MLDGRKRPAEDRSRPNDNRNRQDDQQSDDRGRQSDDRASQSDDRTRLSDDRGRQSDDRSRSNDDRPRQGSDRNRQSDDRYRSSEDRYKSDDRNRNEDRYKSDERSRQSDELPPRYKDDRYRQQYDEPQVKPKVKDVTDKYSIYSQPRVLPKINTKLFKPNRLTTTLPDAADLRKPIEKSSFSSEKQRPTGEGGAQSRRPIESSVEEEYSYEDYEEEELLQDAKPKVEAPPVEKSYKRPLIINRGKY